MGQAWPRFLPATPPEAIAHALIIEAQAIIVEQLGDGQRALFEAHERAMVYARSHFSDDEVRAACNECATAPGNTNILLHHLVVSARSVVGVQQFAAPENGIKIFGFERDPAEMGFRLAA